MTKTACNEPDGPGRNETPRCRQPTLEIKDAGPGGAEVDVSGSYSVSGRVASMASSHAKRKADKILEEFFTQVGQELGTAS